MKKLMNLSEPILINHRNLYWHVNLFKSDVFTLGLVGLEMGGVYDSEHSEKFQSVKAFKKKIKECLNLFQNKYQSEIEKNEENQRFFRILKNSLVINSKDREDFIDLFQGILSINDKNKIKYHIFVEDHENLLYSKSEKNKKQLEEQKRNKKNTLPKLLQQMLPIFMCDMHSRNVFHGFYDTLLVFPTNLFRSKNLRAADLEIVFHGV